MYIVPRDFTFTLTGSPDLNGGNLPAIIEAKLKVVALEHGLKLEVKDEPKPENIRPFTALNVLVTEQKIGSGETHD